MKTIRWLFIVSTLIGFILITIDNTLWSMLLIGGGGSVISTFNLVWFGWGYFGLLIIPIVELYKYSMWAALLLLTMIYGNIDYFHGVYFLNTPTNVHDTDWYCNHAGSICGILMLIFGFIYYGWYFYSYFNKCSNKS